MARKKNEIKAKEPVALHAREITGGNQSLYLTITMNGTRKYEFLKLYLLPETSREARDRNAETLRLANAVKAKRLVEIQNGEYGFRSSAQRVDFFAYFEAMGEKRSGGGRDSWRAAIRHIRMYERRETMTLDEVTPQWVRGFRDFLEDEATALNREGSEKRLPPRKIATNSRALYFNKLRTCLNRAVAEGLIRQSPMGGVAGFKKQETSRVYLTQEEVRRLVATPCPNPTLRRAFLFSCLTGLRRSDIFKLTWGEVSEQDGMTRLTFRQRKTDGQEYLDISEQAASLMGERGGSDKEVFGRFMSSNGINADLLLWAARAGIDKHVTFHSGRHTFAVMMLSLDTDLYTVSKLLGHRNMATTQIYAKVLDKAKQRAVKKIPDLLGGDGKKD